MELKTAKEILILNVEQAQKTMPADVANALIIGVSSITRVATMRSYGIAQAILPLKGETSRAGQNFPEETLMRLRESPLGKEPRLK